MQLGKLTGITLLVLALIGGQAFAVPPIRKIPSTGEPVTPSAMVDRNGDQIDPQSGTATAATVVQFQQTTTASAVVLPTHILTNNLMCKALITNTGTVYIGGSNVTTSNGWPLIAGEGVPYGVANSNMLYIVGTNLTDVISCTGN